MLYDRINLLQGADIQNLVVASGTTFPSSPDLGELFFRTDQDKLYVYKSSGWVESGGSGGSAIDPTANQTISGVWSFTQPITGTTPTTAAQLTTKGYVDAAVATKGSGTVTSVGLTSANSAITVSGSPVTSSGNLSITANNFTTSAAGIVPASGGGTTNFLRADGTWAIPTATSTTLLGTGTIPTNIATTAITAGSLPGGNPMLQFVNASAAAGNKAFDIRVNTSGVFQMNLLNDTLSGIVPFLSVNRTGQTTDTITLAGNSVNITGLSTGLKINGAAGSAGQVLTSNGSAAAPTWTTLSSSGTVTSVALSSANDAITVSGSPITTSGTLSITANNFTSTIAGVVPASGGGTTNFLRADGTWAAPTATTTSLTGTGAVTIGTNMGVYAGVASGLVPVVALSNSSRPVDNRVWGAIIDQTNGNFVIRPYSDALTAGTNSISLSRSGNTTTSITLNATTVNLSNLTSGLQINGSTGTSGQVLTSQGASAAPIWASASVTALNGTGTPARSGTATGIYAGVDGASQANVTFTNGAAAAGARASHLYTDSSGNINWAFLTDNLLSQTAFMTVSRSGNTATEIRLVGTAVDLAIGTGGLQINNSAGSSGQVLTSQGASAAPIWAAPSITSLTASTAAASRTVSASTVWADVRGGVPLVSLANATPAVDSRAWSFQVTSGGTLQLIAHNDTFTAGNSVLDVARSGTSASTITVTGTSIVLNASVDFGARYTELSSSLTATASTTINCAVGNIFTVTMSSSITTLAFSNVPASGRAYNMTLILAQDATGGRSITWPASVKWPNGTAPTLSAANKVDIITLMTTNGGATWYGLVAGQNF